MTVNSFLASGGDNFTALTGGTSKQDTGKADLQAMVDYMAEFANAGAGDPPLPVDCAQQAVGVKFPAGAPASYQPGTDHVKFDLTSLAMTESGAVRDTDVTVKLGGTALGTFPVETVLTVPDGNSTTRTRTTSPVPRRSTSCCRRRRRAVLPTWWSRAWRRAPAVEVPVTVTGVTCPRRSRRLRRSAAARRRSPTARPGLLEVLISRANATGQVEVTTEKGEKLGTVTITGGKGTLTLAPKSLKPGEHELTLKYLGTSEFAPSTGTATVQVTKPKPKVKIKVDDKIEKSEGGKVTVRGDRAGRHQGQGKVELIVKGTGKSVTGKLVDGKVVLKLPKLSSVDTYTLKAIYLGSALLAKANKSVKFELVK